MPGSAGNALQRIAFIAFVACLSLLVPAGNVAFFLSSSTYLYSLAAATATPQNSQAPADSETAALVSAGVISYVTGSSERMKYALSFTNEELSHLADVRRKIAAFKLLFYFLAAASAAAFFALFAVAGNLWKFVAAFKLALLASGAVAVAVSALLFLLSSANFGASFTGFHKILFAGGQWQFPSNYLLVNLFTEEFFAAFAKDVVVGTLIFGVAIAVFAAAFGNLYRLYLDRIKLHRKV